MRATSLALLLRTAAAPLQNSSANRVCVSARGDISSPLSSDATARDLSRAAKRNPLVKTKRESIRRPRQDTAVKAVTISGPAYRPAVPVNYRQSSRRPANGQKRRDRIDGAFDAQGWFQCQPRRARGAGCERLCGNRRGIAQSRDAAARRSIHAAALSALRVAPGRRTADGQRQLHVLPRDHAAPAGRENGVVLAPSLRHGQLEGRQLRPVARADPVVPRARHGQLPRPADDRREKPDHDFLAGQQSEPRHGRERELGPRTARIVQPRCRQLHRDRRARGLTGVHRLDIRHENPPPALRALPLEVRVSARGS